MQFGQLIYLQAQNESKTYFTSTHHRMGIVAVLAALVLIAVLAHARHQRLGRARRVANEE